MHTNRRRPLFAQTLCTNVSVHCGNILMRVTFHVHCIDLQLFYQALNFAMIVSSALMIWKGLMVHSGSESPIVVVLR